MFQVLVSTPPAKTLDVWGLPARSMVPPRAGVSGTVTHDRVAVFAHLEGQRIRCGAGSLWVTVENDREDHVVDSGQEFLVATPGKVIISGRGGFEI
jgi:hypothetical protein